jgi:hypothetical protein
MTWGCVLLALLSYLLASEANAATSRPWDKHPLLSGPNTPIRLDGSDDEEITTSRAFFGHYTAAGIPCVARDGRRVRQVVVTCSWKRGGRNHKTVYAGGFYGIGYLVIEHVEVDGEPLDPRDRIDHLKLVAASGPGALERLPSFPRRTRYANARRHLLATGWAPYTAPDAEGCILGRRQCKGRPETRFCSGTGIARCGFLWRKEGATIDQPSPIRCLVLQRALIAFNPGPIIPSWEAIGID